MARYGLEFDIVESSKKQRQLRDFMLEHVGGYPPDRHERWVLETCMPGIEEGSRRALAWWQNGRMIGDAVLKLIPGDEIELKHFRMEDFTKRGAARFMMGQALHEAREFRQAWGGVSENSVRITLDTPANSNAEDFFSHMGFERYDVAPLYDPNVPDALMQRTVSLE